MGERSHFVVTERINRDFGLLGVIRCREKHGHGHFLNGRHFVSYVGSKVKGQVVLQLRESNSTLGS